MTQTEYLWAWSAYLLGAGIFFGLTCYWTRKWRWFDLGNMLRLAIAVLLFLPWYTDAEQEYLSPAWLVSAADYLTLGEKAFWRSGLVILVVLVLVMALASIFFTTRWYLQRRNSRSSQSDLSSDLP